MKSKRNVMCKIIVKYAKLLHYRSLCISATLQKCSIQTTLHTVFSDIYHAAFLTHLC